MVIKFCIYWILMITELRGLFVSVGNYSDYNIYGLNVAECGLENLPIESDASFGNKCFYEDYQTQTIKVIPDESDRNEDSAHNRMFNGYNASIGEAPWHVLLIMNVERICGGSLITMEWILTAAHCLDSFESGFAFAGSNTLLDGVRNNFDHQKVIQHKYYVDPESANMSIPNEQVRKLHDIGMVKLTRNFTRTSNNDRQYIINTICLPGRHQMNTVNELATFTGFGFANQSGPVPNVLQVGTVTLVPSNMCPKMGFLCQFREYNQTKGCSGDSGGGLFQRDETDLFRAIIAGVYVGGTNTNCSIVASKQYWTVPSKFINWILENIRSN